MDRDREYGERGLWCKGQMSEEVTEEVGVRWGGSAEGLRDTCMGRSWAEKEV